MPVGTADVDRSIGAHLFIFVMTVGPPLLRFYVLRARHRTSALLVSDLFLGTALTIVIISHALYLTLIFRERDIRRQEHVNTEQMVPFILLTPYWLKFELANTLLHFTILWLVKGAFLALYWSVLSNTGSWFSALRHTLRATAVILVATWVSLVVLTLTYCPKLSNTWNREKVLALQFCHPFWSLAPATILLVFTLATDLMIFIIPLVMVGSLELSRLEKQVLPVVFFTGIISFIAPLARYTLFHRQGHLASDRHHPTYKGELTLDQFHLMSILAYLETMGAILAFSLPAFKFVLRRSYWRRGRPFASPSGGAEKSTEPKKRLVSQTIARLTLERSSVGADPETRT